MTTSIDKFVVETCQRLQREYIGEHGLLVTTLDGKGRIIRDVPLIADFGDVLPFLHYFGFQDFALEQVRRAEPYLWNGLYQRNGRIRAFFNHDFLLGLLELYTLSGEHWLLEQAILAVRTLHEHMTRQGIIFSEIQLNGLKWRPFPRANPYNGGFIEVLVDLYQATCDSSFLEQAEVMGKAWLDTPFFQRYGLFRRIEIVGSDLLSRLILRFAQGGPVYLFKDNSNLVYSLLSLFQQTGDLAWRDALERWLEAFGRYFWNDGNVYLWLDREWNGHEPHLKAGFPALDLLCDLYQAGIGGEQTLQWAKAIGDFWLNQQWPNGLFPHAPAAQSDHLDANADLVIALYKLSSLTRDERYRQAGYRCREALLTHHSTPAGYVLSIGQNGEMVNDRIIVKYQGLMLKLALLPEGNLYNYPQTLSLLRDR